MRIEPRALWVLIGGGSLAALSSAVNVIFLIHFGTSVSHLTGDLARFAQGLSLPADQRVVAPVFVGTALVGFVVGAMLSGYFIHHRSLELARPYGRSITAIGFLILTANFLFAVSPLTAVAFAGVACGFQNALASHYKGVVLRTTHVTGLLTDFGVMLGMRVHGKEVRPWLWAAPLGLVVSYFLGAAVGAGLTLGLGSRVLGVIGLAYVFGGIAWSIHKRRLERRLRRRAASIPLHAPHHDLPATLAGVLAEPGSPPLPPRT